MIGYFSSRLELPLGFIGFFGQAEQFLYELRIIEGLLADEKPAVNEGFYSGYCTTVFFLMSGGLSSAKIG